MDASKSNRTFGTTDHSVICITREHMALRPERPVSIVDYDILTALRSTLTATDSEAEVRERDCLVRWASDKIVARVL
jgi:hypothetical protein